MKKYFLAAAICVASVCNAQLPGPDCPDCQHLPIAGPKEEKPPILEHIKVDPDTERIIKFLDNDDVFAALRRNCSKITYIVDGNGKKIYYNLKFEKSERQILSDTGDPRFRSFKEKYKFNLYYINRDGNDHNYHIATLNYELQVLAGTTYLIFNGIDAESPNDMKFLDSFLGHPKVEEPKAEEE